MKIGYFNEHRGLKGTIEYSYKDGVYYGRVMGVEDFVNYEAANAEKLYKEFKLAVDDYLDFRRVYEL